MHKYIVHSTLYSCIHILYIFRAFMVLCGNCNIYMNGIYTSCKGKIYKHRFKIVIYNCKLLQIICHSKI